MVLSFGAMSLESAGKVAVIGAGTMGAGIAQLAATAGYETALFDMVPERVELARRDMDESLTKLVSKGVIDPGTADRARKLVRPAASIEDAASGANVVIEAVIERLDVKQESLSRANAVAAPDAILGTNTSQLSITAIASALSAATDRVVGLHFFNPAVLMRLVEIVAGLETSAETLERARHFSASLGKETVVCRKDSPGFLTSRISAIVRLECLRMLEEGVGTAEDIDRALRLGLNFPIGPLELGDRNGHDTYLMILESLVETLGERFRPTVGLRNLVAAGRYGRKSGRGIYDYDSSGKIISAGNLP